MADETSSPPQPTIINELTTAVYPSFAMLAGMQLDLFTPLKDGPMAAEELADALGVQVTKLRALLYALVSAGLLTAEGQRFANTPEAEEYLVRGRPRYMGAAGDLYADLWPTALKTAGSVRTGAAQAKHDFSAMSESELNGLIRGLHPFTVATGRELVGRYDFSPYRTLVDVGGGSGGLAIFIAEVCPHIRAVVLDLPTVTPIAQQCVEEAGAADRVRVIAADVVDGPLPEAFDVAVLRNFIQVLSPEQARRALRNVMAAINPGGAIYIFGAVLDDSRLSPPPMVGLNLFLINAFDEGQAYTEREYREWLADAGFEGFERVTLRTGFSIVRAGKR